MINYQFGQPARLYDRMTIQKKAKLIAFSTSLLYVGIGTIKLFSITNNDGMVFSNLGEQFENVIMPSYLLGFALGYRGGFAFGIIGQLIVFGICFMTIYGAASYVLKPIEKKET